MNIVITGGVGYIRTHIAIKLIESRHYILIVDNLSNCKIEVFDKIKSITQE